MARHQTLRGAIEWSYQLLDPDEQVVLERLSVFAGDFNLAAAQAVAASDDIDVLDVLDLLVRLVAKSLLVAEPRGATTRYRLLETVREFAWEHLDDRGEADAVSRRHALFYAAFARDAGAGLRGADETDWRERVGKEVDNLRAALTWAIAAGDVELALQPVTDLSVFGDHITPYGLLPEDAARMDELHPLAAVALANACYAASLQGKSDLAWRLAEEAIGRADALDRSTEGLWVRCRVANGCCIAVATQSEIYEYGERWLGDARELGEPWSLMEALTFNVGGQDLDKAIERGQEALTIARSLGSQSRISFAAVLLAGRLADSDPERARELLAEGDAAAAAARNDWSEFTRPTAACLIQVKAGDFRGACETLLEAIEQWAARGLPGIVMPFVHILACLLYAAGDKEGALLLAEWAQQRGMHVQVNQYWAPFGVAELEDYREGLPAAERDRAVRTSVLLDDFGLAAYARNRVTTSLGTREAE